MRVIWLGGLNVTLFLGRSEEQTRFRAVLAELRAGRTPDEAHVVLVTGLGGIGKSTLLRRYEEIAAEDAAPAGNGRRGLLVARVDWESERRLRAADFALDGGPPIWVVLDRVYQALSEAAAGSKRDAGFTGKAFGSFRFQVMRLPELAEDVRREFPGSEAEKVTTAADVEAVLQAVGRGAAMTGGAPLAAVAAGPAAKGIVGAGHLARDAWGILRQYRHGMVPEGAYRLVLRRVEELTDTFARCLRAVSERRPMMVVLDTCELVSGSQEYLRRAMRVSGSRVLWVIGARLDPDPGSAGHAAGEVARYRQVIRDSRLQVVSLSRFSDDTIGEYVDRELPGRLGTDVTLDAVVQVTRGIPLAVSLVCDLLKAGQDTESALRPVPEPGQPSAMVRALAERYLVHALTCPPLQADVPLLYGLALLHSDRLDPDLLAALWDVDPGQVADMLADLAGRHAFVLRGRRALHDDVRDTIRLHLLDDALRVAQRPMNQRATVHLSARLGQLRLAGAEEQVASEEWKGLATALLWHTFWAGNRAGLDLLLDLLPAAAVLAEPFGVTLLEVAQFFLPALNDQDKRSVEALGNLARLSLRQPQDADRSADGQADPLALRVLESHHNLGGSVLAPDIPREVYLSLLNAKHAQCVGGSPGQALAALEHAADVLGVAGGQPGATSRALADVAEHLAESLIFVERWKVRSSAEGLRAAELATSYGPSSSTAWWLLAVARGQMGQHEGELAASDQAIRLEPGLALAHNARGVALSQVGRSQEALQEYDEAIRLAPDYAVALSNRASALTRIGQLQDALEAAEIAVRVAPGYLGARQSRTYVLRMLGRFGDALDESEEAIRIDSGSVPAHNNRGLALHWLGRFREALDAFDTAAGIDPENSWAHANRSLPLRSLGRFHDALDACDTAIRLNPENFWAHANRGLALESLGRAADAVKAHDSAIRLDPADGWLHADRARCLIMMNHTSEAIASLKQTFELSSAEMLEARVLLAALLRLSNPGQSAGLARAALTDPGRFLSPFRRAELKAIAHLLLSDQETAAAEFLSATSGRTPGDLFERPLYDLLNDQSVTGTHQLLAIWDEIDPSNTAPPEV